LPATEYRRDLRDDHHRHHGEDDQIVPIDDSARIGIKLLKHGTLKTYPGFPHGMATTHADVINPDLLAFIQS